MLFAGWEVRIVKNCDQGLKNAAQGRRPRAAFSSLRSQFFTIWTDPKPVNNFFFPSSLTEKTHASVTVTAVRDRKIRTALRTNQILRYRYRARLEKTNNKYLTNLIFSVRTVSYGSSTRL